MTEPRRTAIAFRSALVVGSSEGHVRIDREFLKLARIPHLRSASSGIEGLAIMRRQAVDLVVCDERLDDMGGRDFVATLRADPALARIPVIMAALAPSEADVLRAVSLGAAGFLIRPYSQDAFMRHLRQASQLAVFADAGRVALARATQAEAAGDPGTAATRFAAVATDPGQAPRLFEEGMTALAAKDVDRAITAFHRALAVNALYVEAYLGLARAWLAKGSTTRYRFFMKQAASACARARRFEELRDRFVELLARDEAGFNPFLALGNELLAERHYTAAVALFRHAKSLAPQNADVSLGLAKAYHFLRRPDLACRAVEIAMGQNDRSPEGQALYTRLTGRHHGDIPTRDDTAQESAGIHYPWLLRGVLYLAGWAADGLLRSRRPAMAA
jgi:CheY-like chemotaxis protein